MWLDPVAEKIFATWDTEDAESTRRTVSLLRAHNRATPELFAEFVCRGEPPGTYTVGIGRLLDWIATDRRIFAGGSGERSAWFFCRLTYYVRYYTRFAPTGASAPHTTRIESFLSGIDDVYFAEKTTECLDLTLVLLQGGHLQAAGLMLCTLSSACSAGIGTNPASCCSKTAMPAMLRVCNMIHFHANMAVWTAAARHEHDRHILADFLQQISTEKVIEAVWPHVHDPSSSTAAVDERRVLYAARRAEYAARLFAETDTPLPKRVRHM